MSQNSLNVSALSPAQQARLAALKARPVVSPAASVSVAPPARRMKTGGA